VLKGNESSKAQADLFAGFDKSKNPQERRESFAKLSPERKQVVLAYFKAGQSEQPNEKELIKGVYGLFRLYENIDIAKQ